MHALFPHADYLRGNSIFRHIVDAVVIAIDVPTEKRAYLVLTLASHRSGPLDMRRARPKHENTKSGHARGKDPRML